jgi:hypothetical protein
MGINPDTGPTLIARIAELADDFEKTASMVNESSRQRKKYTEDSLGHLDSMISAEVLFLKELKAGTRQGVLLRGRHAAILNACRTLIVNLSRQDEIMAQLKKGSGPQKESAKKMNNYNAALKASLGRACFLLESIIGKENRISFLDSVIVSLKSSHIKNNRKLKIDSAAILEDTKAAIENSATNNRRGLEFVKKLKGIGRLTGTGDREGIKKIIDMAIAGGTSARIVNRRSLTQFRFSDLFFNKVKLLHAEATLIRDKAREKYELFNISLEDIAELAVVIAVELNDYMPVKEFFRSKERGDNISSAEEPVYVSELAASVDSVCRDIQYLAGLNFDMSDNISLNSNLESKTLAVTEEEIELYRRLKISVEKMTEAARFPIEGSSRNIRNARDIEKALKKMAGML